MVQHEHTVDARDAQALAEHRSKTYWFLSTLFLDQPTAASLGVLRTNLAGWTDAGSDGSEPLLDELQALLESLSDLSGLARDLSIEHTQLFHGIQPGVRPAPPYESVHRESRLVGEITGAVVTAYARAGYRDIHPPAGPQDHIGVELKFLSLLCYDEAESWSAGKVDEAVQHRVRQADFLRRHACAWIPAYCRGLEDESRCRYYRIVGQLTRQALERDRERLCGDA